MVSFALCLPYSLADHILRCGRLFVWMDIVKDGDCDG
nr:MAG TPA: hypothetical protein [Caudoviricetes sp.]